MSRFGAFPRTPALRGGSSGAMLFGGRKESSPQLRAPPRSFGVRPRTTPLLAFISEYFSRFYIFSYLLRRRSSKGVDAIAEMPEGAKPYVLAPPTQCAHKPAREGQKGSRAGLPAKYSQEINFFISAVYATSCWLMRVRSLTKSA